MAEPAPGGTGSKVERGGLSSERVGALRHRRLLVRRLVGMDDALARGLVQLARRVLQGGDRLVPLTRVGGLAEAADRSLQRRLDRLVAQPRLLVGLDALELGLDVRHARASGDRRGSGCAAAVRLQRDNGGYQSSTRRPKPAAARTSAPPIRPG